MNMQSLKEGGGREDVCNPLKTILFKTCAVAEGLERPPPGTAHVFRFDSRSCHILILYPRI
jgi:hypothetical protein